MPRGKVDDAENAGAAELGSPEVATAQGVLPTFAEIYAKLAAPFDKTFERDMPGGRGKLTYIRGEQAMQRLTEVTPEWAWTVDTRELQGSDEKGRHVVVTGTLSITFHTSDLGSITLSRAGTGGAAVKLRRDGSIMDLGNDYKAAETGALKRAGAKFGVGLYLYEKDDSESDLPQQSQPYGQQGTYAPAGDRQAVQFAQSPTGAGGGTTGPIEAVSMPKVDETGKQRLGGLKVGGNWFNVSNRTPIQLGQFQRGQVVTVQHQPGSNFIDGVQVGGGAQAQPEEITAF